MKIVLDLNPLELSYLRDAVSDLGNSENNCLTLQLKIADAIINLLKTAEKPGFLADIV